MRSFRALTLVVAVLVFGGLAADAGGTTAPSGLYGKVMRGPITPVCRQGVPCDAPASGVTLVFSRAGRELARTVTRKDGTYRIRLAAGAYGVSRALKTVRPLQPQTARVPLGRFARVDFSIDTGIR